LHSDLLVRGRDSGARHAITKVASVLIVLVLVLGGVAGYLALVGPGLGTPAAATSETAASSIPAAYAGIGEAFTSSELASINGQPLSDYQTAGEMLLNGSIANTVALGKADHYQPLVVNGKPSVVLLQAISCSDCAMNRWAQALALATFGNFTALYKGYSAMGTDHVTTIYWGQDDYTVGQGVTFGSSYVSEYLNFYAVDYDSPVITGGFQWTTLAYLAQHAPNSTWQAVTDFMENASNALGNKAPPTDTQLWGSSVWFGGIAVILGNSTSVAGAAAPVSHLSHDSALAQISRFDDQYAWSNYAAADVYIAGLCPSLTSAPPVCSLPAIVSLEGRD
jgi:hypothetical protein